MKRFLIAVGGLAIVVVAIGFFLFANVDAAIKAMVETVGSRATGTPVMLKSADLSLRSGKGRLSGLVVANPTGYKTPTAFELGDIQVTLDISTIRSVPIVINEVAIDNLATTYELSPRGSNIGAIQSNIAGFAKALGGAETTSDKSGDRRFVIGDLYVRGGRIVLSASFLGGKAANRTLPDIHLHDLGRDRGGITAAEIAAEVVGALTSSVLRSAADIGTGALNSSLHAAKNVADVGVNAAGSGLHSAKDAAGSGAGAMNGGLHAVEHAGGAVFSKAKGIFHK